VTTITPALANSACVASAMNELKRRVNAQLGSWLDEAREDGMERPNDCLRTRLVYLRTTAYTEATGET
jgi:hypothetical protein